jgi:hypothetical protein
MQKTPLMRPRNTRAKRRRALVARIVRAALFADQSWREGMPAAALARACEIARRGIARVVR